MKKLLLSVLLLALGHHVSAQVMDYPYCQIADRITEPAWHAELGYIPSSEVNDRSSVAVTEWDAAVGMYYMPTDVGTIDVRARHRGRGFGGRGGINLPAQVGELLIDASWTIRQYNGLSIRLNVKPGIYSDFEDIGGQDLFVPFGGTAIYAFNELLSAQAGLNIYPGFDRYLDPVLGFRASIYDVLLVDLGYPETRVTYTQDDLWQVHVGYTVARYPEYQLEKDDARDRLRIDEDRLFFRWNYAAFYDAQLVIESGIVMNRSFDYDFGGRESEVDDSLYFRVGLSAML